jgi:hypothetical protein
MAGLVTRLQPGQPLDPTATYAGPWRSIETTVLDAGHSLRLDSSELESAVFVERGAVTLALSHTTVVMYTRDAVTLVKGASALFTAGDSGASLFITRLQA